MMKMVKQKNSVIDVAPGGGKTQQDKDDDTHARV